jgi:hypothetical protein
MLVFGYVYIFVSTCMDIYLILYIYIILSYIYTCYIAHTHVLYIYIHTHIHTQPNTPHPVPVLADGAVLDAWMHGWHVFADRVVLSGSYICSQIDRYSRVHRGGGGSQNTYMCVYICIYWHFLYTCILYILVAHHKLRWDKGQGCVQW